MYLLFIRVIGHKTSLGTSQVTATNLSRVRGGSTNHISFCNPGGESEPRGGIKGRVFSRERKSLGNVWDHAPCFQVAGALFTKYFHRVTLVCGAYRLSDTNTGVATDK